MFCSKCGLRISNSNANFCKRCGNRLGGGREKVSFRSSNNTNDILQRARNKLIDFTSPRIEKTKHFTVKKLDSWKNNIQDQSKYQNLSHDQRTFLAQKLASLRNSISSKEEGNNNISVEDAQEFVDISDELLKQIKEDKCLICYKPLQKTYEKNTQLVVCPHCGHGGHKNHIYSWFEEKELCPYCKTRVNIQEVLLLNL
ncbi:MAG: hypothetical protein ACC656_06820 [Candidatus Heimdallarchaeota archaeon]